MLRRLVPALVAGLLVAGGASAQVSGPQTTSPAETASSSGRGTVTNAVRPEDDTAFGGQPSAQVQTLARPRYRERLSVVPAGHVRGRRRHHHGRRHHRHLAGRCANPAPNGAACSGVDRNHNGISDKEDRAIQAGSRP